MALTRRISQALASITTNFQQSVCRRRASKLAPNISKRAVLSSNRVQRKLIRANTYGFIRELELRHARIEYMIQRSGFVDLSAPPGLRPLTCGQQLWHLAPLLRRALGHCDDIADIGARTGCPHHSTRCRQVTYIRSLDLEAVSCLLYLLIVLSVGYIQGASGHGGARVRIPPNNPIEWEIVTVFEEGVLRHGSWYLWAHVTGVAGGPLDKLKNDKMMAGLEELTAWETGKNRVLPGLKMTVLERFRRLAEAEGNLQGHQGTTMHMFEIIRRLVHKKEEGTAATKCAVLLPETTQV